MPKLKLIIPGIPQPKQSVRARAVKAKDGKVFARTYQTSRIEQTEVNIQSIIISQLPFGFKPFEGPVRINRLHYIFPPLKSFTKASIRLIRAGEELPKTTKPDITDNLAKGLIDAMQGIIFLNDSQIYEMNNVKKFYGFTPKIEIELEEILFS